MSLDRLGRYIIIVFSMKSSSGILSNKLPVQGPAIEIINEMVSTAISKVKCGKAAGSSGIIIEMIKAAGDEEC